MPKTLYFETRNTNRLLNTPPRDQIRDATSRVCRVAGCGEWAWNLDGRYKAGFRTVRVWACDEHFHGDPLRIEPVPEMVAEVAALLEQYTENQRKRYTQDVTPEKSESVKVFAATGHGEPVRGPSRFASWRWGEQAGDVSGYVPKPHHTLSDMILAGRRAMKAGEK